MTEVSFEINEYDVYYILNKEMTNLNWPRMSFLHPAALFTLQDIAELLETHAPNINLAWERGKMTDYIGIVIDNELRGSIDIESPDMHLALYHYVEGYLFGKLGVVL